MSGPESGRRAARARLDEPPRRTDTCPSDLVLDRLRLGEIDDAGDAQAHIDGCDACQERLRWFAEPLPAIAGVDVDAMLARIGAELERDAAPEPGGATAEAPTPGWVDRLAAWLFPQKGYALAGSLSLVMLCFGTWWLLRDQPAMPSSTGGGVATAPPPRPPDVVRSKGGLGLTVIKKRGGAQGEAVSGDRFAAGDRLRFRVSVGEAGHIMIVGLEAGGSLYAAYPAEASSSAPVAAGAGQLLDEAIELDDSTGREWLFAVRCDRAFSLAELAPAGGERLVAPAGCETAPFLLVKVAP